MQYSSTCPASAALSRQLIQEQFARDFADGAALDRQAMLAWLGTPAGIVATPHSQRSSVTLRVKLAAGFDFPITELIDRVEHALQTPVQTAVKREDEQAFALANGQNLMFCEDAARRIARTLDADERIADFRLRAAHYESLHPHDAVAYASKGVAGGYAQGGVSAQDRRERICRSPSPAGREKVPKADEGRWNAALRFFSPAPAAQRSEGSF